MSDEKLTFMDQLMNVQIVDGKKMITKGDSIKHIDLTAQTFREEIDGRVMPPEVRAAAHAFLEELILQVKERILGIKKRGDA